MKGRLSFQASFFCYLPILIKINLLKIPHMSFMYKLAHNTL